MAGGGKGGGGQPQGQGKGMGGQPQNQMGAAPVGPPGGTPPVYGGPGAAPPQQAQMDQAYQQFQAQRGMGGPNPYGMGAKPPPPPGMMGRWGGPMGGGINSLGGMNRADFMPGGALAAPLDLAAPPAAPGENPVPGAAPVGANPSGALPAGAGMPSPEAMQRMQSQMGGMGRFGMGGMGGRFGGMRGGMGGNQMMDRMRMESMRAMQPYGGGGGAGAGGNAAGDYAAQQNWQGQNAAMMGQMFGGGRGLMNNGGIVTLALGGPVSRGGVSYAPMGSVPTVGLAAPAAPAAPVAAAAPTVSWRPGAGGAATGGGSMFSGVNAPAITQPAKYVAQPQQAIWQPPAKVEPAASTTKKYQNYGILGNTMLGMIDASMGRSSPYSSYASRYNNPRGSR